MTPPGHTSKLALVQRERTCFRARRFIVVVTMAGCTVLGSIAAVHAQGRASDGGEFATKPSAYVPTKLAGRRVVIDPRSTIGKTNPSCMIPPGGAVVIPAVSGDADIVREAFGGLWDCPSGSLLGTGFVAGIDAAKVIAGIPKLTEQRLYEPPDPADAGSVKVRNVKVKGERAKVFVYQTTTTTDTPAGPAGTVFRVASAEPVQHLFVTVTTPPTDDPLPLLVSMLEAGTRTSRRAK